MRSRLAAARLAAAVFAAAAAFGPTSASAAVAPHDAWVPCQVGLTADKAWPAGSTFLGGARWCVGEYQLTMQTDGNFVIYNVNGQALWNTQTEGHPGASAIMQTDGNLVVYQNNTPLWNSGTGGNPGGYYYLCFQTDGNLVIYAPVPHTTACNGAPRWDSNT
ncbi:hypothetical protein [Streptacidiphilus melanogenes]|uniref:hypothetical protein n=1 Tax=Streptacidiphilus melanogenes TaxID=411235 RepID=UPI000694F203|nr:hypothetical protein [Streptacidiphilus melanogenes]